MDSRIKPVTPIYRKPIQNAAAVNGTHPEHTSLLMDQWTNSVVKSPSNKQCLSRLLTFQTFFGVTYLGRCAYKCNMPGAFQAIIRPFITFFLMLYQLSSIVFLLVIIYYFDARGILENYFDTITKKKMLKMIFQVNVFAMGLEFVMLQFFSFIRGPIIADIIFQIGPDIHLYGRNHRQYLCIYPILILLAVIGTLSPMSLFEEVWTSWGKPVWGAFILVLEGALGAINKSWIMTIHIYASSIICQTIDNYHSNLMNYQNYGYLLRDMIALKRRVDCLNKKMGWLIFVKLFLNCVMLASYICGLIERMEAEDSNPTVIVAILTLILQIFIIETGSCHASQRVQNRMLDFVESIQELMASNSVMNSAKTLRSSPNSSRMKNHSVNYRSAGKMRKIDALEYHCLEQICTMGEQVSFQVCNMFVLKSVTILIILTNVFNYAILFRQQATDTPIY